MPSFDFSYEYDRAGNRTKKINNLTSEVTTYVYDSANQLISMEEPSGTTTFDWDAAGNLIAKHAPDGTTTYTWDYRNRLTQITPPVGDPINFSYNAMGQRIQKNGTRFIYDGVQMLQETDLNNQTLRSNTFTNEGYGDLISENDGTNSSFPTFNGQSSTDAIVNKTATVTDRISYSAFGGQDSHTGSSTTPFRFVGKQSYYRDSETGLYLLGAGGNPNGAGRYYDPELGRFISRDPLGLAGGDVNLYRYAGNNPLNYVDPQGLTCEESCEGKWKIGKIVVWDIHPKDLGENLTSDDVRADVATANRAFSKCCVRIQIKSVRHLYAGSDIDLSTTDDIDNIDWDFKVHPSEGYKKILESSWEGDKSGDYTADEDFVRVFYTRKLHVIERGRKYAFPAFGITRDWIQFEDRYSSIFIHLKQFEVAGAVLHRGEVLAHELFHFFTYLGVHPSDPANLMSFPERRGGQLFFGTDLSALQCDFLRKSPLMKDG